MADRRRGGRPPDPTRARELYASAAPGYDRRLRFLQPLRRQAIDHLDLQPGQRVLDVACGTGANLRALRACVGAGGAVVGIDLSADMLAVARRRVEEEGWTNVVVLEGSVVGLELPAPVDAALFSFTHDVLQDSVAVRRAVEAVREGGRVAAVGTKWAPSWALPVNVVVAALSRRYITTFDGLDRPWRRLEEAVGELRVHSALVGAAYVAHGIVRHGGDDHAAPPRPDADTV